MNVYTEERLMKMSVHTLRVILRSEFNGLPGVCNKNELISQILSIQSGKEAPARSTKGRKPLGEFITPINGEVSLADSGVDKSEGVVKGIVELNEAGYGLLWSEIKDGVYADYFLAKPLVKKYGLNTGDLVEGVAQYSGEIGAIKIQSINFVNGKTPELDSEVQRALLKPQYPTKKHQLNHISPIITAIDGFCPIGKGQRCLVEDPTGKYGTQFVKGLSSALSGVKTFVVYVGAKPEDVAEIEQTSDKKVLVLPATSSLEEVIRGINLTFERARVLVENGEDVVVVIDSLSSVASCYEDYLSLSQNDKGFINTLLTKTKYVNGLFSLGGNFGDGKSLTVISVFNPSRDVALFGELLDLATSVIRLKSCDVFERRGYVIDLVNSYTDKDELLLSEEEISFADGVRRELNKNEDKLSDIYLSLAK